MSNQIQKELEQHKQANKALTEAKKLLDEASAKAEAVNAVHTAGEAGMEIDVERYVVMMSNIGVNLLVVFPIQKRRKPAKREK